MKKLLNILLCLCLSIVYGKSQITIVKREIVKPKFETLNTDSIDLTSLKESDEKIYGMPLYELYRQYIGKRFIQYNSFSWAYVPERQFLDLPTPLTIDLFTENNNFEKKIKGKFNISKIGTYVYNPIINIKKRTVVYLNDLRGGSINSFYTLKKDIFKRKYLFELKLPEIQTKDSIRYLTLKDVIFVEDEEEFLNKFKEPADYEVLRDDTGDRLYKSIINGKEYYSKKVKDDVGIYNDFEYVRPQNKCIFIMADDNGQEFFCSNGYNIYSVDHLNYLKRKYISRIYRDSYYDVVLKVLDIVFMEKDRDSSILELQYKMEDVSSGEISYYSNSTFGSLKEVIPDSYKIDNNGVISF